MSTFTGKHDTGQLYRTGSAGTLHKEADRLASAGAFPQAIAKYTESLSFEPNIEVYTNRGACYSQTGQYENAAADFTSALKLAPDHPKAYVNHNNLGYARRNLKDFSAALEGFNESIRLNTLYADAHFNKAETLSDAGRSDEAIASYETFLKLASPASFPYHDRLIADARQRVSRLKNSAKDAHASLPPENKGTTAAMPKRGVNVKPEEELAQLLAQRNAIAALNPTEASYPERDMPAHVFSWFGGIGMILTENWNATHYTVRSDELYTALAQRESIKASPEEWQAALATYYLPPKPGDSKAFHFLLRAPAPDTFIINWPELERFWKSDLMQSFFVLYGRFGGAQQLRSPSTKEEITWCDWLRSRSERAAAG